MKWLVGLFLVWVALRGRLDIYKGFATDAPKTEPDASANPTSHLEKLLDLMTP